ncbi:MAG: hypothetical protein HY608_11130 [Planctomycetes bacterium]|nr:hypothetical protein [Planctomycetota bacterium]
MKRNRLVVGFLLIAGTVLAVEPSGCVPSEAFLYGEARDLDALWDAVKVSPVGAEARALLEEFGQWEGIQAGMESFRATQGIDIESLLRGGLGHRAAVAVRANPDLVAMLQGVVADRVVHSYPPRYEQAQREAREARERLEREGILGAILLSSAEAGWMGVNVPRFWEEERYLIKEAGTYRDARCITKEKAGRRSHAALRGDLMVESNDRAFLEAILDRAAGGEGATVESSVRWQEACASLPEGAQIRLHLDGRTLAETVPWAEILPVIGEIRQRRLEERIVLPWLETFEGVVAGARLDPAGWCEAQARGSFDAARVPQGAFPDWTKLPTRVPEGFRSLPADAWIAGATRFDAGSWIDRISAQIPESDRALTLARVAAVAQGLGIAEPGRFVRECVGPEAGMAVLPGPVDEYGEPFPPRLVLWLALGGDGAAQVQGALSRLEGWLLLFASMQVRGVEPPAFETRSIGGADVRVLRVPPLPDGRRVPVSPCWAVHAGRLWFSTDVGALERILTLPAGESLADSTGYQATEGRLRRPGISLAYLNVPAVVAYGGSAREWIAGQIARKEGRESADVSREFDAVLRLLGHVGPVLTSSWAEGATLGMEAHWEMK